MKRFFGTAVIAIVFFVLGAAFQRYYDGRRPVAPPVEVATAPVTQPKPPSIAYERAPLWAYGFETPAKAEDKAPPQAAPTRNLRPNEDPAEQTKARQAKGSRATYSLVDVRDGHNVIDWFPQDHPSPMPPIIKNGPAAGAGNTGRGCGSCHLPNGKGRPENAPPAGLPVAYFMRQLQDFRNGLRQSADPRKPNTVTMIDLAKAMTDEEMKQSADYFAAIRWTPWIRVVETDKVPKTRIVGNLYLAPKHDRVEPIDGRIIEVPEDLEQAETLRNPRSGFVAYIPGRQHREGEGSRHHGGHAHRRQPDRAGQDDPVCHLPRPRFDGRGRCAAAGGPLAQLHRAPDVGHSAGRPQRSVCSIDEAGDCESEPGRSGGDCLVRVVPRSAARSDGLELEVQRDNPESAP